ncbi:hypothetical protein [Alkalihalobacillus sp. LMS39]|uniref:hypothetical protein n=1 Tax=Alkalihalobacillus sp. LMS39 TaxID=2924032 RepID=UPI001FB24DA5|nr:hypothetical protein [Alkalihalobacillus sp. LMS39]UOE93609.1 hypothetical protein MM271_20875 [Alkalihalobacillus sp. LMS39]
MNKKLVALREVSREEFMELAQSGTRELFDLGQFKVLDAWKGEEQRQFVYDMGPHRCFEIDKNTGYDLVTAFYCGGNKQEINEALQHIVSSM